MKILVCTDGSEHSKRAIEAASKIVCCGNVDEVGLIHVNVPGRSGPYLVEGNEALTEKLNREFREMQEQEREKSRTILSDAAALFKEKNIEVKTLLREGRAAEVIIDEASDGGYDIIVLGSRGLSGLKKMFLGSVSNAVLMESKSDVLIVR